MCWGAGLLFCTGWSEKHCIRVMPEVRKDARQKSGGKVLGQREQPVQGSEPDVCCL